MIEKINKNEIYDLRSTVNLLTAKINEIIDYINKENSGEVDYKEFIDLLFPNKN